MEDKTRKRARLVLILGVLLAMIAGAATFFYASSAGTEVPAAVPTRQVLVAAREIPRLATISAADVRLAAFKEDTVPASALGAADLAVGRVAVVPMSAGEPVLPAKLSSAVSAEPVSTTPISVFPTGEQIAPNSPAYRALSMTVPDQNAVGGLIQAGDIVDIVYAINVDPATKITGGAGANRIADFSAKIVVERVPILARSAQIYTIRTDAATAERLAYMQASGGQLQFLLRAARDDRASGTAGATFADVYREMRIKVPERVNP